MNHRKIIGILFVLSFVGALLGFVLIYPESFGMCKDSLGNFYETFCYEYEYEESFGEPFLAALLPTIVTLFVLLFVPQYVYVAWKKFVLIYFPLAILWIVMTPKSCLGCWLISFPERESVAWIAGSGFAVISFLIIIYQILKVRLKDNQKKESST